MRLAAYGLAAMRPALEMPPHTRREAINRLHGSVEKSACNMVEQIIAIIENLQALKTRNGISVMESWMNLLRNVDLLEFWYDTWRGHLEEVGLS